MISTKGRKMKVKIKRLDPRAYIPEYATPGAAAVDLHAVLDEPLVLWPGETKLIGTGLSTEFPENVAMILAPRSGLGANKGIVLANGIGVIDSDFKGEIKIAAWNRNHPGDGPYTITPGERLCQAMFIPVLKADFEEAEELEETDRGDGGFGSTGRK